MQIKRLLVLGVVLVIGFVTTDTAYARGSACPPPSDIDDCIHFFDYSQMAIGMSVIGILLLVAWFAFRKYLQSKDFYVVKKSL